MLCRTMMLLALSTIIHLLPLCLRAQVQPKCSRPRHLHLPSHRPCPVIKSQGLQKWKSTVLPMSAPRQEWHQNPWYALTYEKDQPRPAYESIFPSISDSQYQTGFSPIVRDQHRTDVAATKAHKGRGGRCAATRSQTADASIATTTVQKISYTVSVTPPDHNWRAFPQGRVLIRKVRTGSRT